MNLPFPLILASTSQYRAALLAQLGWPFESVSPGVDENKIKDTGLSPEELARTLSLLKAKAVHIKKPQSCVIGSDQVCTLGNSIFSKPGDFNGAIAQLSAMQGKTHELITAVSIISPLGEKTFVNKTKLQMRSLKWDEMARYLEADKPYDCAGSYKLESHGIRLFEKIEMDDHTSIIGLPLIELTNQLLKLGYTL